MCPITRERERDRERERERERDRGTEAQLLLSLTVNIKAFSAIGHLNERNNIQRRKGFLERSRTTADVYLRRQKKYSIITSFFFFLFFYPLQYCTVPLGVPYRPLKNTAPKFTRGQPIFFPTEFQVCQ